MNTYHIASDVPAQLKKAHSLRDVEMVSAILNQHNLVDIEDHTFLNLLDEHSTVLDLGAWRGNFADSISQQFSCRVDTFEPNKNQLAILHERFSSSELVSVYDKAIGGVTEVVHFYPSPDELPGEQKGSSLLVQSPYVDEGQSYAVDKIRLAEIPTITGNHQYDLIKMDIEGAELEVFNDDDSVAFLASAKLLSIEFHYKMPMNDQILIPEADILKMAEKLKSYGFNFVDFGRNFKYIDCLFYKNEY